MKKRILVVSIVFLTVFISIIAMSYNTNTPKTFTQDGITYALTLDGASVSTFPSKGMYRVDVECNNATGKWLYDEWKLAVEDINGTNATCDVSFNTINTTYLNNYIIGLNGTTQGNGQVVNENGYRYEGQNPNNYIWFNNELWKIIGVFDEESHGVSGQNLVKIIRADSIGGLAWDKSNTNDWTQASLMNLLNGAYLNSENGTGGEYCYGYSTLVPGNCDYTETGINSVYRPLIKNVIWYLGKTSYFASVDEVYLRERNDDSGGKASTTTGYIGLMYASDYGYGVLASSCGRTIQVYRYDNSSCSGKNWLYTMGDEHTLTASDTSGVISIGNYGNMHTGIVNSGSDAGVSNSGCSVSAAVRPVLYLDSSVYVMDGNGSVSDPYIIGM